MPASPFLPSTCIIDSISHLIAIDGARLVCVIVFEDFLAIENLRTGHTQSLNQPSFSFPHFTLSSHLPGLDLFPEMMELLQVQPPRSICLEEEGQGYWHIAKPPWTGRVWLGDSAGKVAP